MKALILALITTALATFQPAHAENEVILDAKLEAAIEANDIQGVKALITADPSLVTKVGFSGITALHLADDKNEIAKLLVAAGADVNAPSMFSGTPLHRTIKNGNRELAAFLIEKGADLSAVDADGLTVVHCLAWIQNQARIESLFQLIEARKPGLMENPGKFGRTPLWMCVDRINIPAAMFFLYQGADPKLAPEGPGSSAAEYLQDRLQNDKDLTPEAQKQLKALASIMRVEH